MPACAQDERSGNHHARHPRLLPNKLWFGFLLSPTANDAITYPVNGHGRQLNGPNAQTYRQDAYELFVMCPGVQHTFRVADDQTGIGMQSSSFSRRVLEDRRNDSNTSLAGKLVANTLRVMGLTRLLAIVLLKLWHKIW